MIDLEKEIKLGKLKDVVVACRSLVDEGKVTLCLELMATTYKELSGVSCTPEYADFFNSIPEKRLKELHVISDYICDTAYYMDGCQWEPDKGLLESYVDHVCDQNDLSAVERVYIMSRIVSFGQIASGTGARVAVGIAKGFEW